MASRGLGTLTLDLIARIGAFEQGMDKAARHADKRMRDIENRANKFGKALGAALATGAAAAVAGLIAVTKNAIDAADRINDISQRLGVSTEALSAWGYAAQQSGTDLEALNGGLTKFTKAVASAADASSRQGEIFAGLGISVKDAAGNLRTVEELLPEVATAFKEMNNATLESSLSMELFGKSGAQLLQFLNLGESGLDAMAEKARSLGLIISQETATAADDFNDGLADLKGMMAGIGIQLASDLLPSLQSFIETIKKSAQEGGLLRFVLDDISGSARDLTNLLADMSKQADHAAERFAAMGHVIAAAGAVMSGQFAKAAAEYKAGQAILDAQAAPRRTTPVPDLKVPFLQPLFPQFSAVPFRATTPQGGNSGAAKEAALNALLAGGGNGKRGGGGGSRAKKDTSLEDAARDAQKARDELARLVEQEEQARDAFEAMAASLAGPLADANYQFIQDQERLNELAKQGAIGAKELEAAQANLLVAHEKEVAAINARLTPAQEMQAALQEEIAMLGMTNEQQEIYNNLKFAEVEANSAAGQSIVEMTEKLQQAREARMIVDDLKGATKDFFVDLTDGAGTAREAWDDFMDGIKRRALEFVADKAVNAFFDMLSGVGKGGTASAGGGASGGGFWANLLGAFFGGGKASGGWTQPNRLYEVNEKGFEMATVSGRDYMLTGSSPVKITPNSELAAAGGDFNFSPTFILPQRMDNRTQMHIAQASGNAVREASRRNKAR